MAPSVTHLVQPIKSYDCKASSDETPRRTQTYDEVLKNEDNAARGEFLTVVA